MNTIQNNASPLVSKDAKKLIRSAWRILARQKKGTASQHAAYHLLLGHDLDRAFTPLSRISKINGYALGNAHMARDLAREKAESGDVETWSPWADFFKEVKKSGNWNARYEGGIEVLRAAIEAHVQAELISVPVVTPLSMAL